MGKNTPGLDHKGKEEYIELHLFNELRWLLGAATEWSIQDQLKLEKVGYNVQVYAMDSAVLHARALFEFWCNRRTTIIMALTSFLVLSWNPTAVRTTGKDPFTRILCMLRIDHAQRP